MADKEIEQIGPDAFARIQEYREQFVRIKEKHELPIDDYNELFSYVTTDNFKICDVSDRICVLQRHMNRLLAYANQVVEDIQLLVSEQTTETPVYFSNCIIVELQCKDDDKCASIVESAWDALPDDEHKTLINIFKLKDNVNGENYQRYGIFYAYNDEISTKTPPPMNQLISYIYSHADANCINNRFIVIPQLPPPCRLKYSYKSNMQKEINRFNQTVCDRIVPYFRKRTSSQIALIQKSDAATCESLDTISGFTRRYPVVLDYEKLNWPTLVDYSLTCYENGHNCFPRLNQQDAAKNSVASLYYFDIDKKEFAELIGTATICSFKGIIFALTCMHCLSHNTDQIYALKLKTYGYHTLYGKAVKGNPNYRDDAPAEQEVAVLKLYWDSTCTEEAYFEPGIVLDSTSAYCSSTTSSLTCFGYPSDRGVTVCATHYYEANDGYLEFIIEDNDRFKPGFSGALFIDENKNPFAIAYSYQENGKIHAYGIPITTATMRAQEILEEGE